MNKKDILEQLMIVFIESELVSFTVKFVNDLMNIIWLKI